MNVTSFYDIYFDKCSLETQPKQLISDVTMAGPKTDKAFVIKRMAPSTASYLLVVKKELLVGNFASSPLAPQIGAIIVIDYRRHSENDKNKIDVCSWNPYDGYNAMVFRLAGKATDKELKFCGSFYTCGHIRYKGEPLSHPAIFNDFIGVVEDKHDILDKNYIGKLWATVMYCETSDSTWELCCIDKYLGKTNKIPLPYSGIVGAVNQGPDKNMNYITSRDFPHDVRFFSGTNV
ncbi:hypothetical protein Y032_0574g182 [Ancylostoma ceylanicum]|nr:hypothetical protein Y032_0574g182 [Ancylostoma ceylanicum]